MKKIAVFLIIMVAANLLYADRIHLRDSSVAEGKIIQITPKSVEYDPAGDKAFEVIPRDEVVKIEFDDGKTVRFLFDIVSLNDGTQMKGTVDKVDSATIFFTPDGEDTQRTIPRDTIQTITFSDGKEIEISAHDEKKVPDDGAIPQEEEKQERIPGFHKSIVRVSAFIGTVDYNSDLINEEEDLIFMRSGGSDMNTNAWSWGIDLDLMLPALEFSQRSAFSFTGIKFGIRGRFGITNVESGIIDVLFADTMLLDSWSETNNTEMLLTYTCFYAGPVVDFIFSTRYNYVNLSLQLYALGGGITGGRLRPGASLDDAGISYPGRGERISVGGYSFRFGFGPHFILNRWVPLDIGLNVVYATTIVRLERPVGAYANGRRNYHVNEYQLELVMGFHY